MERKKFIKSLSLLAFAAPVAWACTDKQVGDPLIGPPNQGGNNGQGSGSVQDVIPNTNCVATPSETEGPFPTKTPSSYVRSDIRKGDNLGVNMDAKIKIVNSNNNCKALEGVLVDIWHCDVDGNYSQYGATQMQSTNYQSVNWYRGRQVTDSNGDVTFKTIFPGWYMGRATHIHVHVYDATGKSLLVTQIAFQDSLCVEVNQKGSSYGYKKGISGYTYNNRDNVFSDGVDKEMSVVTGSLEKGFVMNSTIRVKA